MSVVVEARSRDDDEAIGVVLAEGYTEEMRFDQRDLRVRRAACSVSSSACQHSLSGSSIGRTLLELVHSPLFLSNRSE